MKKFSPFILLFSFILLAGGVYGFIKASSLPSLVMSVCFAAVLIVSSFYIQRGKVPAFYIATLSIFILHLFFLFRFFKSLKMMPAGMMVLLTTAIGAPLLSYLTKKVKETVYQK